MTKRKSDKIIITSLIDWYYIQKGILLYQNGTSDFLEVLKIAESFGGYKAEDEYLTPGYKLKSAYLIYLGCEYNEFIKDIAYFLYKDKVVYSRSHLYYSKNVSTVFTKINS